MKKKLHMVSSIRGVSIAATMDQFYSNLSGT